MGRQDMMKLLWIKATKDDILYMEQLFDLHMIMLARVETPPMLSKKKRRELLENFNFIDKDKSGRITYQDLVDNGLIEHEMAVDLRSKYDYNGRGVLDQSDFLEML